MSFIAGAGLTNIDLLYTGMPRIPDVGEEIYSEGFELQLGGGLPATLINLGRLGIPTKIATLLGNDIFSEFAKEKFRENNVEPENLYEADGIPVNITSAIILKGDRSFITYGRGFIDTDENAAQKFYKLAHGSKITLMQPGAFLDVYRKLHDEGTTLILDTGWDDELSIEKYREYLEIADYYTPNKKEALKITDSENAEEAIKKLGEFFEKPVVKLDKEGVLGMENGRLIFAKSVEEFINVDSTGAGDAFLAGFAYGIYKDRPFEDCLIYGNITGGKCVTKAGALSAYVTEEEMLNLAEKMR